MSANRSGRRTGAQPGLSQLSMTLQQVQVAPLIPSRLRLQNVNPALLRGNSPGTEFRNQRQNHREGLETRARRTLRRGATEQVCEILDGPVSKALNISPELSGHALIDSQSDVSGGEPVPGPPLASR